tara:strand:- start:204103 stop:206010 length:1908 start_codon:yes stop_codon:yes gene_type:complete
MVALLTVASYWVALDGPLLFDDQPNITQNQLLMIDGAIADEWRSAAFSSGSGPLRRPISMLSFAANGVAGGEFAAFGLKLTNLLIHLVTGVVFYAGVLRLAQSPVLSERYAGRAHWLALAAATLWLLHPLHVSTVMYAVQRMAQLTALFMIAGVLVYAIYRNRWARHGGAVGELLAAALWLLLLTALAAYSKENGLLLPWLLVAVEVAFYRGIWAGKRIPLLVLLAWLALLAPLMLGVLIYFFSPEFFTDPYLRRPFDLSERLLTQSRMLWHYLSWLAWPDVRAMGFQHDDLVISTGWLQPWTALLACVAWLLAIAFSVWQRNRLPLVFFAVVFFLVGHAMESGPFALEMVYEHRNYLPSMAVCLLLAGLLVHPKLLGGKADGRLVTGGVVTVLALLLFVRSDTWSDELVLAQRNVDNHPQSARAHYFLGDALLSVYNRSGEHELNDAQRRDLLIVARQQFERMYELEPDDSASLVMLYIVDSLYFPELAQRNDWLAKIAQRMEEKVFLPSDYASVTALMRHLTQRGSPDDAQRVMAILEQRMATWGDRRQFLLPMYLYNAAHRGPYEERRALLARALAVSPGSYATRYYLASELVAAGDIAGAYESIGQWLQRDQRRWQLPLIKSLFHGETSKP